MPGEDVGPGALRPLGGGAPRYGRLIATGGIGHGILLTLEGNGTLGRNESRRGRLEPVRDYCKLHIVSHYVSVFMGAGRDRPFEVVAIGRIGDDDDGQRLAAEMSAAGITMDEVGRVSGADTLFSVCFLYPDKSGGNITAAESASSKLAPGDIDEALERHPVGTAPEIVAALPEVPVETRVRLLHIGRQRGCRTIASVLPGEVGSFRGLSGFEDTDLLAVNTEEARAIAGCGPAESGSAVARACMAVLKRHNPRMDVAITEGRNGSYGCSGDRVDHFPGLPMDAVSTAGAGDAFLSGIICGLCCGLPFLRQRSNAAGEESGALSSAIDLGTLVAAMSVTSPHTIHPGISAASLLAFIRHRGIDASSDFLSLLERTRH